MQIVRVIDRLGMTKKQQQDPIYLLDQFLMSDRAPDNSMGVSDIDGLLTGIAIGPELIMPSEWLPVVWGKKSPRFKDDQEAQSVMSAIMERYNEIVRAFQQSPPDFEPVFWETKDGLVIAADWAEGFNDAIKLRPKAWKRLFDDKKNSSLLRPVKILCGSESYRDGDIEAEMMRKAADDLTESIIGIHRYWRGQGPLF